MLYKVGLLYAFASYAAKDDSNTDHSDRDSYLRYTRAHELMARHARPWSDLLHSPAAV